MADQVGPSSFGAGNTTTGPSAFRAGNVLDSQRYRELDRRQSYYDCTQHDYKRFDFDGRVITTGGGISATQPLLSAEKYAAYIPLRSRRPSAPYRLARVIVNGFTNLVFGEGRFPEVSVEGDPDTEDFARAVVRAMSLPVRMIQARNLGGAVGTVGLSWCFLDGKPRCQVHNAKNLFVHEWEDRELLIPAHVSEVYQYPKDEYDAEKKRYVRNLYWYRRDWTPNTDVAFKPVLVEAGKEPFWEPDLGRSSAHDDGFAHFVWIQNLPSDDVDGLPDYEGLYESFDTIDLLLSVVTRGATLNLDPTLKLKVDPDLVARFGVKKGSDNALILGLNGDADYLELDGSSIEAGVKLFEAKRRTALEVAQCVVPDPDTVTANGTSSVAMRLLYAPMVGKGDMLREQYGDGMRRLLEQVIRVARVAKEVPGKVYNPDGSEEQVQRSISLPPRVTNEPVLDENGAPTGEETSKEEERWPGEGGDVELEWGPYFQPTPTDQQMVVTTLAAATANQPFMSQQTAVEIAMAAFGKAGGEEYARVAKQAQQVLAQQSQMFSDEDGSAGGKVTHTQPLPGGGSVKRSKGPPPAPPPGADDEDKDDTGGGAKKPPKGKESASEEV